MVLGWMAVNCEECGNTATHSIGRPHAKCMGCTRQGLSRYGSSQAWIREKGSCIYWLINKFDAWRRNCKKSIRGSTMLPCSGTKQESLNWKKGKNDERITRLYAARSGECWHVNRSCSHIRGRQVRILRPCIGCAGGRG